MATFSVNSANYNGTGADPNPKVYVRGQISHFTDYASNPGLVRDFSGWASAFLFWGQIQQANLAGGSAAVRALLAVEFFNNWQGPPFVAPPVVPASSNIPLPIMSDSAAENAVCIGAMVGSWEN